MKKISDKNERFIQAYCTHLNATKAAEEAGYSTNTSYSIGQRLLKDPRIKERIEKFQDDLSSAAEITALQIITELKKIAFCSVGRLYKDWHSLNEYNSISDEAKSAISEITTRTIREKVGETGKPVDVQYVKIKMHDKQRALETLNSMLGFNKPEKVDITLDKQSDIDLTKLNDSELMTFHTLLQKAKPDKDFLPFIKRS